MFSWDHVCFGVSRLNFFRLDYTPALVLFLPQGQHRTNYVGNTVKVEEGATATFVGQVVAKEVSNVSTLFRNDGSIE